MQIFVINDHEQSLFFSFSYFAVYPCAAVNHKDQLKEKNMHIFRIVIYTFMFSLYLLWYIFVLYMLKALADWNLNNIIQKTALRELYIRP